MLVKLERMSLPLTAILATMLFVACCIAAITSNWPVLFTILLVSFPVWVVGYSGGRSALKEDHEAVIWTPDLIEQVYGEHCLLDYDSMVYVGWNSAGNVLIVYPKLQTALRGIMPGEIVGAYVNYYGQVSFRLTGVEGLVNFLIPHHVEAFPYL